MKINKKTIEGIYTLFTPEKRLPVIFDSPHSGKIIPSDFKYSCDDMLIKRSIEHFIDELIDTAPQNGITTLLSECPRSYIDLNRTKDDIDEELLEHPWPHQINKDGKSIAGIGLIRRLIMPDIPLYDHKLSHIEIQNRIKKYYIPYHKILKENIEEIQSNHGYIYHINWHSMPSSIFNSSYTLPFSVPVINSQPDFILGNQDGKTCTDEFIHFCKDTLKSMGYRVYVNKIYKGAEIVKKYGDPENGYNSLQIEINRSIFMNEDKCKKTKDFKRLKTDINKMIQAISYNIKHHILSNVAD